SRLVQLVPGQPEIATVNFAGSTESDPLATPWILRLSLERNVERDRSRHIANRQVPRQLELLLVAFDSGAPEFDHRKLFDVQEIPRTKVIVALFRTRVDTSSVERHLDRRIPHVILIG